ncbi:MAG: LPS export ABC transporter periplasmic protein LptC [Fusobacteriaceae bacterium]
MRKKTTLYILCGIVVFVLGYLNYFSNEGEKKNLEKIIETTEVKYVSDGYKINADKQIDYVDKSETSFYKAKAMVKDMILSGDNAFLDAAKNLVLKSNIFALAPNGWDFKAENINYDKIKDEITSTTNVLASNKELNLNISGNNFKTDSKMSYIELSENVSLENKDVKLTGDLATYVDVTKQVVISDNIKLNGKNLDGKFKENITGEFKNLIYNLNKKNIETSEKYKVSYGDTTLFANYLYYNEENGCLKISGDVSIETNGYKIYLDWIERKPLSEIIILHGKIRGSNGVYSFLGNEGEYNLTTKTLTITGDIVGTSTSKKGITADKIEYNSETEIIKAFGEKIDVIYTDEDKEIRAKEINFNNKTKELQIDVPYNFKNKEYVGVGKKLLYNDLTEIGFMESVIIQNKDRKIITSKIEYIKLEEKILIPNKYEIITLKSGDRFISQKGEYNIGTRIFSSSESFKNYSKETEFSGKGFYFNDTTGIGEVLSNVEILNKIQKYKITADKSDIKKSEYIDLIGNVKFDSENYVSFIEKARYTFIDKIIRINNPIEINSKDGKSKIKLKNPEINTVNSIIKGTEFVGNDEIYKITSDLFQYDYKEKKALLINNGVISNNKITIKGNNLVYIIDKKEVQANGKYNFSSNNLKGTGENLTINNLNGKIQGGKILLETDKKDKFQAKTIEGNLKNQVLNFKGEAKGIIYDKGKETRYKGDLVRVLLEKFEKKYVAKNIILVGNSTLEQDNVTLYSKKTDVDLKTNIVYSYERPKIVISDEKTGITELKSDNLEFHMDKDIILMNGDIFILNKNKEKGDTTAKSEKGIAKIKEKIIELEENVVIDYPEAILRAGKGIYDMGTKKIKASGKVIIDYKKNK